MRSKIRNWLQDEFLRHTGIMMMGTGLVNIFNLLYHLAIIRLLSVVDYGILNSLISITVIFSQFNAALRPALTKFLAVNFARGEFDRARLLLRRAARDLSLLSGLFLIIFILGAGPLATYQQIENRLYVVLVGVLVSASTMAVIPGAFLWGGERFKYLAGLNAFSTFLKLAVGVGLVWAGLGVSGALIGYNAYPLFMLIVGFLLVRFLGGYYGPRGEAGSRISMMPVYAYFIPTAVALFSFAILTNLDVLLVKHFFLPREAGFYSVAQMVGKIILYLPGAVSIVVFPKAASAHAREVDSFPLLKKGLLIVALFNVVATVVCALIPGSVLKMLTGKTDPESIQLVMWFALAMSFYSMTWLTIFYNLSIHNTRFIKYLAVCAIAQTACIYLYHPGLKTVVSLVTLFAVISFIIMLFLSRSTPKVR